MLFVIIGLALFFAPNLYVKTQEEKVNELNILRRDLDFELVQTDILSSLNPIDLPNKFNTALGLRHELSKIDDYKDQKQKIIDSFDSQVNSYLSEISKYSKYLKSPNLNISTDNVTFEDKKDPESFLKEVKVKFRDEIDFYNDINRDKIYYQVDPDDYIASQALESKVGQLFVFSGLSTNLSNTEVDYFERNNSGGIVLLSNNVENESQLIEYANEIQGFSHKVPFFVAVDQEGGLVKRIYWDETLSQIELNESSLAEICSEYQKRDELLASLGINWNFGLVADVTSDSSSFIFERTFGSDYFQTAEKIKKADECTSKTLTTLKHYPGHGATNLDTHLGLADITKSEEFWENEDAIPFVENLGADSIMIGHLVLEWLDSENPASLSTKVQDHLGNELNYQGLIVSDDLFMLESAGYSTQEIIEQALQTEINVFLYSYNTNSANEILNYAIEAVRSGKIPEEKINGKIKRIIAAKNKIIASYPEYIPYNFAY